MFSDFEFRTAEQQREAVSIDDVDDNLFHSCCGPDLTTSTLGFLQTLPEDDVNGAEDDDVRPLSLPERGGETYLRLPISGNPNESSPHVVTCSLDSGLASSHAVSPSAIDFDPDQCDTEQSNEAQQPARESTSSFQLQPSPAVPSVQESDECHSEHSNPPSGCLQKEESPAQPLPFFTTKSVHEPPSEATVEAATTSIAIESALDDALCAEIGVENLPIASQMASLMAQIGKESEPPNSTQRDAALDETATADSTATAEPSPLIVPKRVVEPLRKEKKRKKRLKAPAATQDSADDRSSDALLATKQPTWRHIANADFSGEFVVIGGRMHYEINFAFSDDEVGVAEPGMPAAERQSCMVSYTDMGLLYQRLSESGLSTLPAMPPKRLLGSTCEWTAAARLKQFREILAAAMEQQHEEETRNAELCRAIGEFFEYNLSSKATGAAYSTELLRTADQLLEYMGGDAWDKALEAGGHALDLALRATATLSLGAGVAAALVPIYLVDGVVWVVCNELELVDDPNAEIYGRILRRSMAFITLDMNPLCKTEILPADVPAECPGGERTIFVCNHTSMADVMVLSKALPWELKFLSMGTMASVPIVGNMMENANDVFVHFEQNQHGHHTATNRDEAMAQVEERVCRGMRFMIFPEGKLRGDGKLNKFKSGAFRVALNTGADIVPVALTGAATMLPPGASVLQHGTVRVKVGQPIKTKSLQAGSSSFDSRVDLLRERVQGEVQLLLDELQARERGDFFETPVEELPALVDGFELV